MKLFFNLIIAAIFASLLAGGFIECLNVAVDFFQQHSRFLIWMIPMAGAILYYLGRIKHFRNCEHENSPALTPYMYLTATWSHLFGASVGREGAAIQIGASVAEWVRRRLKHEEGHRPYFAMAGIAAAFATVLAAPFSAVIFAIEYRKSGQKWQVLSAALGAAIGWGFLQLAPIHHWHAPTVEVNFSQIQWLGLLGLSLGLWVLANSFVWSEDFFTRLLGPVPMWMILPASGAILSLSILLIGHTQLNNFSLPLLDESFVTPADFSTTLGKIYMTFISLTGGWKGGAFVPLMVSGALFASWLGSLLGVSNAAATAVGVFSVIHKKFKIPLTSVVITGEIFSWRVAVLSLPAHLLIHFFRPQVHFEKFLHGRKNAKPKSSL